MVYKPSASRFTIINLDKIIIKRFLFKHQVDQEKLFLKFLKFKFRKFKSEKLYAERLHRMQKELYTYIKMQAGPPQK